MSVAVSNCQSWELDVTSRGVYLTAYLVTSSHIWSWSLHLTSCGEGRGISDSQSGYFISHVLLVTSSAKFWGVYLTAYLGTSSHIWSWSLHVIIFGVYIWQLIWVLHLTSDLGHFIWLVVGNVWTFHLKTWPNSTICFEYALIDNIDQQRTLLLALAVSYRGYFWSSRNERKSLSQQKCVLRKCCGYLRNGE